MGRLTSLLANSAPMPSGAQYPSTLLQEASWSSGHNKIAPAANIGGSKRYILYVPGPTCRGPAPLCMPPFSYKRGGMRRYTKGPIFGAEPGEPNLWS
jgi:hypothetical protein